MCCRFGCHVCRPVPAGELRERATLLFSRRRYVLQHPSAGQEHLGWGVGVEGEAKHGETGGYGPLTSEDSVGYEGLDTWLWRLSRVRPARARAHRLPLASQRSHALAGRR